MKSWKSKISEQTGITGLETAIVLIAFVIVASVLSYVVVSAGMYSSQKAKDAVLAGLEQSGATVELKGDLLLKMDSGFGTTAYCTIGLVPGGSPIDLTEFPTASATATASASGTTQPTYPNKLTIAYHDSYHIYPSLPWTMVMVNNNNGDNMLDPGELAMITIDLTSINTGAADDKEKLGAYHSFTLEIKPPNGSVMAIERTLPSRVTALVNLR
jgi:archaeal flagellin FlaB